MYECMYMCVRERLYVCAFVCRTVSMEAFSVRSRVKQTVVTVNFTFMYRVEKDMLEHFQPTSRWIVGWMLLGMQNAHATLWWILRIYIFMS